MLRLLFSGSETENRPSELTTDTIHDKFHGCCSRQALAAEGGPVGRKGWSHRGLLYGSAFRTWVVQGQFVVAYVPE